MSPTTSSVATSTMSMTPESSAETHSSARSGVSAKRRGRVSTRMSAITSCRSTSMTWTRFAASEATKTSLPSGVTCTPSGSSPVSKKPVCSPVSRSKTVAAASSSLET